MVTLTERQIDIIKSTWMVPKANMVDSGEAILMRFFEKYPQNQNKFITFKDEPLKSLKGNAVLRNHGSNVMKIFDDSIQCFDKENGIKELGTIWTGIGDSHSKMKLSRESFMELKDVVLEIMTVVCKLNVEQQRAWDLLFDNIYGIVFMKLK